MADCYLYDFMTKIKKFNNYKIIVKIEHPYVPVKKHI